MKLLIAKLVNDALASLPDLKDAAVDLSLESTVERTRDPTHGDFATNVAMRLAKPARKKPSRRKSAPKKPARKGQSRKKAAAAPSSADSIRTLARSFAARRLN